MADEFGVKVKIYADDSKESKASFEKSVQSLSKKTVAKIHKVVVDTKDKEAQKIFKQSVQTLANKLKDSDPIEISVVKVKDIDCDVAIKNLKKQIEEMLSTIKVDNYITKLGDNDNLDNKKESKKVDSSSVLSPSTRLTEQGNRVSRLAKMLNDSSSYLSDGLQKKARASLASIEEEIENIRNSGDELTEESVEQINNLAQEITELENIIVSAAKAKKNLLTNNESLVNADIGVVSNKDSWNSWLSKMDSVLKKNQQLIDQGKLSVSTADEASLRQKQWMDTYELIKQTVANGGSLSEIGFGNPEDLDNFFNEINKGHQNLRNQTLASEKSVQDFHRNVTKYMEANPKVASRFADQFKTINDTIENTSDITDKELQSMQATFSNIKATAEKSNITGQSKVRKFISDYFRFGSWDIVTTSFGRVVDMLKDMVNVVVEVDTAMTELKKVTEETDGAYEKFLDRATNKSRELGTTISDYVTSTANFAKMGFSIPESEELANVATIYSNVGDDLDNIEEATSDIVSTLKAFNMDASEAVNIVDILNEVSNTYAVSSGDLGEGLKNSAAAMSLAGNTLEETIALLAAMTEVTQSADESGNALKVISMRIRGMTTELAEAGEETEGMITNTSELQAKIKALTITDSNPLGVDILDQNNEFKSTYEILTSIAKVWGELSNDSQASILELLAGKTRSNYVSAVITNLKTAEGALATALNSAGSASEEQAKWLDSIQGKTQQFQSAWQGLATSILSADFSKWVVDSGSGLLDFLNTINSFSFGNDSGLLNIIASLGATAYMGKDKGNLKRRGSTGICLSTFKEVA